MRSNLLALGAGLLLFLSAGLAAAQGGDIEIRDAWARATPGGAQAAAIYVMIASPGGDRLTSVSTPVAKAAGMHTMTMDGGVMRMRQIAGIDLPAGTPVTLKPGGYHIMLTGLARPLKEGDSIPLTMTFQKAGTRTVNVLVGKVGAMGPAGTESGIDHTHGGMDMPMHP